MCLFTFQAGLYLNDEEIGQAGRMIVSVLTAALLSSFVLYFLYDLYLKIVKFCRVWLLRDGVPVEEEDRDVVIIAMWAYYQFNLT